MYGGDVAKLTRTVVDGIRKAGCRAVLASGWGGLGTDETLVDPAIFVLRHAPHEWLMPRMAGALYHGGAGTTAAVVRAGIPALVMPFITEQAFWSVRLERLGVAAPRLDRRTVTADRLAQGLRRLRDPALRAAAAGRGRAFVGNLSHDAWHRIIFFVPRTRATEAVYRPKASRTAACCAALSIRGAHPRMRRCSFAVSSSSSIANTAACRSFPATTGP